MSHAMERFLSAVAASVENQAAGESVIGTIKIAVLPIAKVFTMCFLGFLMASKYVNILPANGRKLLNGVVIPMNVVLGATSGSLIGNIGNVPLVLIAAYAEINPILSVTQKNVAQMGLPISPLARISFTTYNESQDIERISLVYSCQVGAIILYTYVFHMLAPPPEGTFEIEDGSLPLKNPPKDAAPEQVPLLTQEDDKPIDSNASKKGKIKQFLVFLYEKLKLKQILQPPIIASILAMFLGAVPFLKRLIFTTDAPLYFFTDSCNILGEAMIPCILLALGGNLVDGPGSSKLGLRTTAAIIFARLILVPPAGLGIVMLADKLGFPPGDKMFRFVLLLQHTMPTSVLSGAVANLRGCGREAAAVLFWVHILPFSQWPDGLFFISTFSSELQTCRKLLLTCTCPLHSDLFHFWCQ
ncbi:hypothetical protein GH714_019730 [Hevea brasiliensis]|uniref:Auxin efflux carrier family protein n=1 Tax=Hevea brasiliensis TaxID=3981 RepID=A0A6A6M009_HEVBR|nr:hypothetical protein GH714_019730 [Hevea brasiliensis]